MPTLEHKEDILTFKEALRVLRVSRSTLIRCLKQGKITHMRIGVKYLFNRSNLDDFLKSNVIEKIVK